jgi:hypothetical protein
MKRAIGLWLALTACAPEGAPLTDEGDPEEALFDEALPDEALPGPTGRLVISPRPAMLRGRTNRTPYVGGYRSMRVWLYGSRGAGVACPPEIAPECLTIAAPAALISTDRAGRDGSGTFSFMIPATAPTGEYALQAGAKDGSSRKTSRLDVVYVLDADEDEDGDSLTNGREIDATHTDPLLRDTDGGGEDDASELLRNADPNDASDDR